MTTTTRKQTEGRPIISLPDIRIAGIPLASILDAAPDCILAVTFARAAWQPEVVGSKSLQWLCVTLMMEFFILHSSAFVGFIMIADSPRAKRIVSLLGLSLFYFVFAGVMAYGFHSWYPIGILAGLTVNRTLFILLRNPATMTPLEKSEITSVWVFSGVSYILSMLVGVIIAGVLREHLEP
jgi:hypothetical protein